MKKSFKLSELDCANCAAKMETAINKLDAVDSATINFMSQRLTLEASDDQFDEAVDLAQKAISKVERGCKIVR
ncbi:cation transporter [Anaerovorax odorimutans]|uniref:Cation transporter n=1 Tax=Anaerovorax odorimutans TaxID=109327 RepID=A0ABT1RNQ9_9FIRM|nr:cation transporter [Anaerovorax odorimutans]MCQ4636828.1 cation transporter [Anaerovorax odorimutans]